MKCILLETKDKRKFFTYEKNLDSIQSFIQIFEVDVKKVKLKKGKILEIKDLIDCICNISNKKEELEYEIIEEPIQKSNKKSTTIRNFIYYQLLNNKKLSVKELKEKFKNYNLCDATFYNYLKKTKELLKNQDDKLNTKPSKTKLSRKK